MSGRERGVAVWVGGCRTVGIEVEEVGAGDVGMWWIVKSGVLNAEVDEAI